MEFLNLRVEAEGGREGGRRGAENMDVNSMVCKPYNVED